MWSWSVPAVDGEQDECMSGCIGSPRKWPWGTPPTLSFCNPCHRYLYNVLISSCAPTLLGLLAFEEEGTMILQNAGNHFATDMM